MRQDQEISPEERIKELIEFEEEKRKELEDKKKELEDKKKELEQLEKEGEEEIDSAREELQKKIEELAVKQRRLLLEEEAKRKKIEQEEINSRQDNNKKKSKEKSLEETVFNEQPKEIPKEKMRGYADAISQIMGGSPTFYDVTNYNVLNRLESIASSVGERPLTKKEKEFVNMVEYHAKGLAQEYQENAGATYVAKELAQIDFIHKMARKNHEGDYNT